jgi:hypothetical protein
MSPAAPSAPDVPGLILQPAHVCGPGTVSGLLARLMPNDMGTLYVDGSVAGPLTLDPSGNGVFTVTKPTTGTIHAITFIGTTSARVSGTLFVNVDPPSITGTPTDVVVCDGTMTSFTASATGATGVQWQVSTDGGATWAAVVGPATMDTYAFTATAADNAHFFRALYTGPCGTLPTLPALLQVNASPMITSNPANAYICASPVVSFSVGATGGSLTYQWQVSTGLYFSNLVDAPPYTGTNSPTLTLTNATVALDGSVYRCVVDNGCGVPANSTGAILTVDPTLPIVFPPTAATVTQSTCQ